ncbi:hypothetical protein ANO11243_075920 [Dothideomycetidae sp. 11243]|nr:hypothetical protein ANO11243_075920 [fungal sp. No.11243]
MRSEQRRLPDPRSSSSTEWLTGLRGYAAACVVASHFAGVYWSDTKFAYGSRVSDYTGNYVFQLPILRLVVDGDAMVLIFFVVSGYSISVGPLRLARQNGALSTCSHVGWSALRRPLRLLVPPLAVTLLTALAAGLGLCNRAHTLTDLPDDFHRLFHGWNVAHAPRTVIGGTGATLPALTAQLRHWLYASLAWVTMSTSRNPYGTQLWTIMVELRGSMYVYLILVATSWLSSRARAAAVVILAAIAWFGGGQLDHPALFWAGIAMCEINMRMQSKSSNGPLPTVDSRPRSGAQGWTALKHLCHFTGLYLLSMPTYRASISPFYAWLDYACNPLSSRQAKLLGTIVTVGSISVCPRIKAFFSNSLARYLGRISFSLYLVHIAILSTVGYPLADAIWHLLRQCGPDGGLSRTKYDVGAVTTAVILVPLLVTASHLFCISVDEPSIRAAKCMERILRLYAGALKKTVVGRERFMDDQKGAFL